MNDLFFIFFNYIELERMMFANWTRKYIKKSSLQMIT